MNYNFQQTAQEKGLDIHSQCNDKEEGTSEQYSDSNLYSESRYSSEQSKGRLINHMEILEKQQTEYMKDSLSLKKPTQTPYLYHLNQFLNKKRYQVIGTFFQIEQQKYIIKNHPSLILSLLLKLDNSYQMKYELNQFLEQKDKNWQQICDFNQPISEKTCEKLQEQYQKIKQMNQTLQKLKEQEKSRKSTEPKKPRKSKDPIDQKEPKKSKEPKDSMKLKAYRKDFMDLCEKKGIATKIQRFERIEEVRKKFDDIENQFKEKNIKDTQLLEHLEALKEFITITQRLKAEHLKNNKKYIKKQIDITKEDILKLMEDPLIKEKSQDVLNIISDVLNQLNIIDKKIDQNQNINNIFDLEELKKLDKIQWKIFQEKAKALLNSENSEQEQIEQEQIEQEQIEQNSQFWYTIKKVKL
ncbi:unnamed protein product [Paramecium primaurelia]|uniref:Uncharacterized protein n=1 Tax=Paramecium primaurelia TaxID=5886 RepID=A0A8S1PJ91_PARPR|nr:unnamed protein product [Paramecium primaurelia]